MPTVSLPFQTTTINFGYRLFHLANISYHGEREEDVSEDSAFVAAVKTKEEARSGSSGTGRGKEQERTAAEGEGKGDRPKVYNPVQTYRSNPLHWRRELLVYSRSSLLSSLVTGVYATVQRNCDSLR